MRGGGDYNHSGGWGSGSILTQFGGDGDEDETKRMIMEALTYGQYKPMTTTQPGQQLVEGSQEELIYNEYYKLAFLLNAYDEIKKVPVLNLSAPECREKIKNLTIKRTKGEKC